ncbi:probable oligoribonuclease isoform X2 [Physella acuta]|uniref:probable oligoribonuclease isoform X2 n=1 Tax=Physella acuta TaxID=109671 RepID=UPI0027DE2D0F|nr:probable oligoribonuclease isoform X2 [Physella acuta]
MQRIFGSQFLFLPMLTRSSSTLFKIKPPKYARQLHFIKHATSMYILPILMKTEFSLSRKTSTLRMKDKILQEDIKTKPSSRLVWIDLEMTGLDVDKERIIEIACVVTEEDLTVVDKCPSIIIHQDDELLNQMSDWCVEHHGESGLTNAVKQSKITTEEAEQMVLEFLLKHTTPGTCPLAGNSVGMDKRFIDKYMPRLSQHLHYRIVDVSTVKELYDGILKRSIWLQRKNYHTGH